jgi:hypothetical protein
VLYRVARKSDPRMVALSGRGDLSARGPIAQSNCTTL